MKRFTLFLVLALALSVVFAGSALAAPTTTGLIAGQDMEVGTVTVSDDGTDLTITYQTTSDWTITETHIYVGTTAPKKAAPGSFPYGADDLDATTYTEVIPLADLDLKKSSTLYIAAHAVVQTITGYQAPSMSEFAAVLPSEPVNLVVAYPGAGSQSYFTSTISLGGVLDGSYPGWCVDTSRTINPGRTYSTEVYSSYDPALATLGLVDKPENFDLVNWIINQGFVGTESPGGLGTYTFGDVQRAIWSVIDDADSTSGLGPWSQARVDEILAAAFAEGEGFLPGCDDSIAVVLRPIGDTNQVTIAQVTFGAVQLECTPVYQEETAWAFGESQFKRGWGWTFTYELGS